MPSRLPSTLICGTIRNGGTALNATLDAIERLKGAFQASSAVIVTNDNTDDTDTILAAWSSSSPTNFTIRLDGFATAYPEHIDRLAAVRNFYLRHLYQQPAGTYEMLLVLDLDGPNARLDPAEFLAAVSSVSLRWDGLFANQLKAYYDIYPLRHDIWSPDDCWLRVAAASKGPFGKWRRSAAREHFIYGRQVRIPPTEPPIRVRSAFGGLGLYRVAALADRCWYGSRLANGDLVCDHVVVNTAIDRQGGALYIVPCLVNEAQEEHLRPESGKPPWPGLFGR